MKDYHFDYIVKNEDGQIVEQDNILHRGSSEEDAKQKALSFLEDVYTEKYYDEFTPTIEMAKDSYAGGGGVRVLKSEGRYRIYGEIHGNKPFLIEATDDRSSLKELTKGAKEWIRGAVGDSRVFVVDTKEDREIFENQYAKGGGIKKRMYGGRACQCRCCPTCNNGWGINTQW
jgi:hypothetical protein